jgi:cobalamin synthase
MSLRGRRKGALDRIEQALLAEDPGLGLRFAFFTRLTGHEAIPLTEQIPARRQRFRRRASVVPLVVISLTALLGATWLIPSRDTCPAGLNAAAHTLSSLARAGHCQPGPKIKLDTMPLH